MMNMIGFLYSFLLPTGVGYLIFRVFFADRSSYPFLFECAIGFSLGTGLMAQAMLVFGILGIPYRAASLALPFILALIGLLIILKKKTPQVRDVVRVKKKKEIFLINLLWGYVIFKFLMFAWITFEIPLAGWDVLATHAFTGKVIFFEKSLAFHQGFPHNTYPLQIPFLEAWVSLNLGYWDDQLLKVIFVLMFSSFLIIFYYYFALTFSHRWGVVALAFVMSSPFLLFHATTGYRDFMISKYVLFSFVFLLFWYRDRNDSWLWLAGLFSAFTSFIKLEGLGYILIHAFCLLLLLVDIPELSWDQKLKKLGKFVLLPFIIASVYLVYKHYAIPPETGGGLEFTIIKMFIGLSFRHLERIFVVLNAFIQNLFISGAWNVVWMLYVLCYLMTRGSKCRYEIWPLFWSVLLFLGIYFFGLTFTDHYYWVTKGAVLSRAILHIFPVAVLSIGMILPSLFKEE